MIDKIFSEENEMNGKYSTLSETEIEQKIKQGLFKEDPNNRVIRDEKNRIVRFLSSSNKTLVPNCYYNQYVQVVNNYVTYTDIQKVISEILKIKNQEIFSELEEAHRTCINFLQQYQYSKKPQIVQKLNEVTLQAISKYQTKLIHYLNTEFKNIDKKQLLDTCWSYLNLIKIFKFSSYIYHNNNILDYEQVRDFIKEIFLPLQRMFEELVCRYAGIENDVHTYHCSSSLYMNLFLDRNIEKLEQYACMDSRFGSLFSITSLIATCFQRNQRNVHEMQRNNEFHRDFVEELYSILFQFKELDDFNELFDPAKETILLDDKSIKNILLPISRKS